MEIGVGVRWSPSCLNRQFSLHSGPILSRSFFLPQSSVELGTPNTARGLGLLLEGGWLPVPYSSREQCLGIASMRVGCLFGRGYTASRLVLGAKLF